MEMTVKSMNNMPGMYLLAPGDEELLKFKYKGNLESHDEIKQFVLDFYQGKLEPEFKNQALMEEYDGPIINMNTELFNKKMDDLKHERTKAFFMIIYSSKMWNLCKPGYDMFKELAGKFQMRGLPTQFYA